MERNKDVEEIKATRLRKNVKGAKGVIQIPSLYSQKLLIEQVHWKEVVLFGEMKLHIFEVPLKATRRKVIQAVAIQVCSKQTGMLELKKDKYFYFLVQWKIRSGMGRK